MANGTVLAMELLHRWFDAFPGVPPPPSALEARIRLGLVVSPEGALVPFAAAPGAPSTVPHQREQMDPAWMDLDALGTAEVAIMAIEPVEPAP